MQEHQIEKVFTEKISGKDRNRPELQKMLDFVREGDTVVIESIIQIPENSSAHLHPDYLAAMFITEKIWKDIPGMNCLEK